MATRINLLPPEITERRKAEGRWLYIIAAALVVFAGLGVFWLVMSSRVDAAQQEIVELEQQAVQLESQADQLQIFADKQDALEARRAAVEEAVEGRIAWGRLFEEISLVLPDDTWLNTLSGAEADAETRSGNLQISGAALDDIDDDPDYGYKAIARVLVRLADLEQLDDVWLGNATKAPGVEDEDGDVIVGITQFQITANIRSVLQYDQETDPALDGSAPPEEPDEGAGG